MTPAIDITAEQRGTVLALLNRYLPDTTIWAYGSRVKWTSRPESDLDLVVFARPEQSARVAELREAFEESDLPFRVDLFVWDEVPENSKRRIKAERAELTSAGGRTRIAANRSKQDNGWTAIQLGNMCKKIGSGMTPRGGSKVYLDRGSYALIRSQNIHNNGFRRDGLAFIDEQQAKNLKNAEVQPHDVLLNITGDSVARCCQVSPELLPARVNQHVAIIRPDPDILDPRFLRYALVEPKMQDRMLSWAGSGATRNALTKEMIESFEMFAPRRVQEQRDIAHILGTLDDKIELNRRMNETLEAMARALFKSWFVDFDPVRAKMEGRDTGLPRPIADLFPDRMVDSELGEMPEEWKIKALGDLFELAYGKALKADDRRQDGNIPVYGSNGQIGWHDKKLIQGPGIVVGRKGNPGTITWVTNDFFPIDTTFYVVPKQGTNTLLFLFHALKNQDLPAVAADSAVPGLNRNLACMNKQIVPNDRIIECFNRYTDALFARNYLLKTESRTFAVLRDTLLPKLISGEVCLRDAARQVESAA